MEAQQPQWREEEAYLAQSVEQEAVEHTEESLPATLELDETLIAAESIKLQAEIAPGSFTDGAEQEEITERTLELRHEIQDDPSEPQAASLGEVIADLSALNPELQKASSTVGTQVQISDEVPQSTQAAVSDSSMASHSSSLSYQQAMKVGFVTALCLIAAFTVLQIII